MMDKVKLLANEKNLKIVGGAALLLGGIVVGEGLKPFHKVAAFNNSMIQKVANKVAKNQNDDVEEEDTVTEEEA